MKGEERLPHIALCGCPNVGKSTLFNRLTGMKQHTGNWTGKTVEEARGVFRAGRRRAVLVDLPGTYSLTARSAEEDVARRCLLSEGCDAVAVVCDASCLARHLSLVLQVLELTPRVVVCVNLCDEAAARGITVDAAVLSERLGVPVVLTEARSGRGVDALRTAMLDRCEEHSSPVLCPRYTPAVEGLLVGFSDRGARLDALEAGCDDAALSSAGIPRERLGEIRAACLLLQAEELCDDAVKRLPARPDVTRRLDRILTGKWTGFPCLLLLLLLLFWITLSLANYPSAWLSSLFGWSEDLLSRGLSALDTPPFLRDLLTEGVFRTLGWVVSVMLPPMAIFFPLFTLLEDLGYLPRIAFLLDRGFERAHACGKLPLTMCMGLGCNAVGVTGCRIMDTRRDRLLAAVTNSFVPCNGRLPLLVTLISLFFVGTGGVWHDLLSAAVMAGLLALSVGVTLLVCRLLSATVLKGETVSFVLELPPYRRPEIGRTLVRSLLDRTLRVLGRAAAVAAPAGAVIWLLARLTVGEMTLLAGAAALLEPIGRFFGLDGAILLAFLLGTPAAEIILPILLMIYTAGGAMTAVPDAAALHAVLLGAGWTAARALRVALLLIFHWPCATTLLTLRRETGSRRFTLLSAVLPTAIGLCLCLLVRTILND